MELWESWMAMARESMEAAEQAEAAGHYRPAASRYYYAAYQAATALLVYRGLITPPGREAWNHEDTPTLLASDLGPLIPRRDTRQDLTARLRLLYELRLVADYRAARSVSAGRVGEAGRHARYLIKTAADVIKTAADVLPEG